jgi:hypothetical protein
VKAGGFLILFLSVAYKSATRVYSVPVDRRTKSLLTTGGQIMTEENYNYRTSQALLRNQFPERENLKFPLSLSLKPSRGTLTICF